MYKNKKIIAIIPARGGSKGIQRKNILEINGKPLINYTIEATKNSLYIDKVIVSTDDEEIAEASMSLGVEVPELRPKHLATDEAKIIDVVMHVLESLKEKYDYVVVLQPTQPLRTELHIDQSIEKIIDGGLSSLVSVSKVEEHPVLMRTFINEKGELKKVLKENSTVRRQDFKNYYKVNGAIYINEITKEFDSEVSLNDNLYGYIMNQKEALDIDTFEDLKKFENIINARENKKD